MDKQRKEVGTATERGIVPPETALLMRSGNKIHQGNNGMWQTPGKYNWNIPILLKCHLMKIMEDAKHLRKH